MAEPEQGLIVALPAAVRSHPLVQVVKSEDPDDGLPDYLVDEVADEENWPDTLYTSDGAVESVSIAVNPALVNDSKQARYNYILYGNMSAGWTYLRTVNPLSEEYVIGAVRRLDDSLVLAENSWLTRRTVRDTEGTPQEVAEFHLLDYDGVGPYSVIFRSTTQDNTQPVADAGEDQEAYPGDSVTLDASASSDIDEDPLTYAWSIAESPVGNAATLDDPTAMQPSFFPLVPGEYVFEVIVDDGLIASEAASVTLTVLNNAPVADAGPDQQGQVGESIQLDGSASYDPDGHPITYAWFFQSRPSGSTAVIRDSNSVDASFTIDRAGNYEVRLFVDDGYDQSEYDLMLVSTDNSAPTANAGNDQSGKVGDIITLNGSASSDPDGNDLTWRWSFVSRPAGSAATISNPNSSTASFVIDAAGEYVVQLVVNDGEFDSAPDTMAVSTNNSAPIANAGPDQTAYVGDRITLDAAASTDPDGDALGYSWGFLVRPDGSNAVLSGSTSISPEFTIDKPGVYQVRLIVNDGRLNSQADTVTVTTLNSAPIADAGANQSAQVGDTVNLDGSGSTDPDGDALTYAWTFAARPAGSTATLSDPASVTPSFSIDVAGAYTLQLIVNDGALDSPADTMVVSTDNSTPVANAGPDQTKKVGDKVTLDASQSSDIDQDELSYAWIFTVKPLESVAELDDATALAPSFTLDVAGNYVLQLTVSDGVLDSPPDSVRISTENSPPVADAGANQTRQVGDTVNLSGSESYDVDTDSLSYSWIFASRPEESEVAIVNANRVNARFVIDAPGDYVVQLIVNDGKEDSDADTVTISTTNTAPVADAGAAQTRKVGDRVTLDASGSSDVDQDELTFSWGFASRPQGSTAQLEDAATINPYFTIDLPGSYVLQLVVNDGTVDSEADTVTVNTTNSAPVAEAGEDTLGRVGESVNLDGSASTDVDGDDLQFSWSFTNRPEGSVSMLDNATAVQPSFDLDAPGEYVLQLIVSDGILFSSPDTITISTENSPPTAAAGVDQTKLVGQLVTLDGRESFDVDNDEITWSWSFTSRPTGSTTTLSNRTVSTPSFRIDIAGSYVVQLLVNDGVLDSEPDTVVVSTSNARPTANAGFDQSVNPGVTVILDGRSSFDPDGEELTFQWSFVNIPSTSNASLNDPSLRQPSFIPEVAGQYVVQLLVNDGAFDSTPDVVTIYAGVNPGGCTEIPTAPSNVSATDGAFSDRVQVSWAKVDNAEEYRVWRADSDDPTKASAISGWISTNVYNDTGALAATVEEAQGCACGAEPAITYNYHYYWIEARSEEDCESDMSNSDSGYRAEITGKQAGGVFHDVVVQVLPSEVSDTFTRRIGPEDALFIRLRSGESEILHFWGYVLGDDVESEAVFWVPVDESDPTDGWVAYYPQAPWTAGAHIQMTIGGMTASGKPLGPLAYDFEVLAEEKAGEVLWQPDESDITLPGIAPSLGYGEPVEVRSLTEEDLPFLSDGYGNALSVAPHAAFSAPQHIWLPLPDGQDLADLSLYYYYDDGFSAGWYPIEHVLGWLVEDQVWQVTLDGQPYYGLQVRFGGIVQFGPRIPDTEEANVLGHLTGALGDYLLLLILAAVLLAARIKQQKTTAQPR